MFRNCRRNQTTDLHLPRVDTGKYSLESIRALLQAVFDMKLHPLQLPFLLPLHDRTERFTEAGREVEDRKTLRGRALFGELTETAKIRALFVNKRSKCSRAVGRISKGYSPIVSDALVSRIICEVIVE